MKSNNSEPQPDPARIEELFHAALELDPGEQPEFLTRASAGDLPLQQTVANLLQEARCESRVWNGPAMDLEARLEAQASSVARLGAFVGPYRIVRRIGSGGMGLVYEAMREDAEFHKRVAIKFVQGTDDPAGIDRFRVERQILADLEHPNIARLLDGGTTGDGIPFLVMEYVEGVPIDKFVSEQRLPRADRLKLFVQVSEAVQYAHRHLVIHRDLKPGNILVTADGTPKLLDFGIAKLQTGEAKTDLRTMQALTLEYASPEQVLGRTVSTSADIYSLGVLLFFLLTGRLPYSADRSQPAELVREICEREPIWQQRESDGNAIQGDLKSILAKALSKEPERRYVSVERLASDVRHYLEGLPVSARPDTFSYRAWRFALRRAIPLSLAIAILAAVTAGVISTVVQSRRAERRFYEVRGLAHSFLFDVYDALTGLPGSLPVRRLVASRAQQYLDRLSRDAGTDSALAVELAESYLRLGDVQGAPYSSNLGDTDGALASYRKAEQLLEGVGARNRDDAIAKDLLGVVSQKISRVFNRRNDPESGLVMARRAVAICESLCREHPGNPHYREHLLQAYGYLAEAQEARGLKNGSLAQLQEALENARKSENPFRVAYALWSVGKQTGDRQYYREALESQLAGLEKVRRRTEHPERLERDLADALISIAYSRAHCHCDLGQAVRETEEALVMFRRLSAAEPQNAEARFDLANAYESLATVLTEDGQGTDALKAHREALAIYAELYRADPANGESARFADGVRDQMTALSNARRK